MLKIWGRKNSSNVRKALWIAHELGLDFESIDAGGAFGVVNEPHYRARNPNGLVPMLEDADLTLWESNTIVRYLCAEYGAEQGWYLQDPRQRALADKWMDWTTSSFAGPFRPLFWGLLRTPKTSVTGWRSMPRTSNAPHCWPSSMTPWPSSHTCPESASAWATSHWAASSTPGSKCRSSARPCTTCTPGTSASRRARPTRPQ